MREGPGAFPFLEMGAQSRDRSAGTGEDNGTGGAKLSPEGGREGGREGEKKLGWRRGTRASWQE
jgi:hypothetical protein